MSTIVDLAGRSRGSRRPSLAFLASIFVLILLLLGMFAPSLFADARLFTAQYTNDRYAFTLDSGHVFYGVVRGAGLGKIVLSDAYSFQSISVGETSTSNLGALRDNPLTRPENWIVLSREHILFYEKIGDDASILSAISAQ
jgi:hypothetical protein